MDTSRIIELLVFFPGFLFSFSFHEAAHAWSAYKFGDSTAKSLGRMTLNPLPHMDPIGTLILPAMGFLFGGFVVGWGKPVPVNYRNLKNWKTEGLYIAVAGPLSNVLLALILAGIIHLTDNFYPQWIGPNAGLIGTYFRDALTSTLHFNLILAFFNMIPVHPLDGGKVLYGILPHPLADKFDEVMTRYGFMILVGLFVSGALNYVVWLPVQIITGLLLQSVPIGP